MNMMIERSPSPAELTVVKQAWRCSRVNCDGLLHLFKLSKSMSFAERTALFDLGQKTESLYLVLRGFVGLLMSDGRGGETLVKIIGPGHFVGESLLLIDDAERFSARALTFAHVVEIPKTSVRAAIAENPCFRRLFFSTLSVSLRQSVRLFSQLKLMNTAQRLGTYLLGIAGSQHGPVRLNMSFERQALAEMLGMQPESLSRAFRKLAELGVSRQDHNVVTIDGIERLVAFCGAPHSFSSPPDQIGEDGAASWKMSRQSTACGAFGALIPDIALFSMLSEPEIKSVLSKAKVVTYDQTTMLFQAGTQADRCFVVISGKVRLFIINGDGRETVIDLVEPGVSFAEAAMFGPGYYPVNAETQPGTRLLHIPKESLCEQALNESSLALRLLEALAQRQKQLFEWIMEFKTRSPTERLVRELLNLTDHESGPEIIHLKTSKASLASHLGVTAETISRIFSKLQKIGVKATNTSKVYIADVAALRSFCMQIPGGDGEAKAH